MSGDGILQRSDRLDRDRDAIALAQELGRIESDTDARAGAGGDQIAGLERHELRDALDQCRNIENELRDQRILPQVAVDVAAHLEVAAVEPDLGAACSFARKGRFGDRELFTVALVVFNRSGAEITDIDPDDPVIEGEGDAVVTRSPLRIDALPLAAKFTG